MTRSSKSTPATKVGTIKRSIQVQAFKNRAKNPRAPTASTTETLNIGLLTRYWSQPCSTSAIASQTFCRTAVASPTDMGRPTAKRQTSEAGIHEMVTPIPARDSIILTKLPLLTQTWSRCRESINLQATLTTWTRAHPRTQRQEKALPAGTRSSAILAKEEAASSAKLSAFSLERFWR